MRHEYNKRMEAYQNLLADQRTVCEELSIENLKVRFELFVEHASFN